MLSFLEPFFAKAEIVFYFLALNSVYSALLALVVLCIKLIFPRMPRAIEYGLWCLVLIRLVLPNDFSISYSLGYLGRNWFEAELPVVLASTDWLTQFANQKLFINSNNSLTWLKLLLLVWLAASCVVAFKFIALKLKLARLLARICSTQDTKRGSDLG